LTNDIKTFEDSDRKNSLTNFKSVQKITKPSSQSSVSSNLRKLLFPSKHRSLTNESETQIPKIENKLNFDENTDVEIEGMKSFSNHEDSVVSLSRRRQSHEGSPRAIKGTIGRLIKQVGEYMVSTSNSKSPKIDLQLKMGKDDGQKADEMEFDMHLQFVL